MATRGMRGIWIGSREFKGQVGRVQVGGASTPGVGFAVSQLGLACFGARAVVLYPMCMNLAIFVLLRTRGVVPY